MAKNIGLLTLFSLSQTSDSIKGLDLNTFLVA